MWAYRASQVFVVLACIWVAWFSSLLYGGAFSRSFSLILFVIATIPFVFVSVGILGFAQQRRRLMLISAILISLCILTPELIGYGYFPAAISMALATLFARLAPPSSWRTATLGSAPPFD